MKNKNVEGIKYSHVDDERVYGFLEKIHSLPINNQIAPFSNVGDIVNYLKEQWAGLFERYLDQQRTVQVMDMMHKMEATTETLRDLVEMLKSQEARDQPSQHIKEQALDAIILQNHPLFGSLKSGLGISYRVFFTSRREMDDWLRARGVLLSKKPSWEFSELEAVEYTFERSPRKGSVEKWFLRLASLLFDQNGYLKPMLPGDWDDSYVVIQKQGGDLDDEIPF